MSAARPNSLKTHSASWCFQWLLMAFLYHPKTVAVSPPRLSPLKSCYLQRPYSVVSPVDFLEVSLSILKIFFLLFGLQHWLKVRTETIPESKMTAQVITWKEHQNPLNTYSFGSKFSWQEKKKKSGENNNYWNLLGPYHMPGTALSTSDLILITTLWIVYYHLFNSWGYQGAEIWGTCSRSPRPWVIKVRVLCSRLHAFDHLSILSTSLGIGWGVGSVFCIRMVEK